MKKNIFVSIVIATFNRDDVLKKTLDKFLLIECYDIIYELIIVDNNSSDNTKFVIEKYLNKLPIVYILEKKQGKNNALNSALKIIKGKVVVFTDDDVTPEVNWLKVIVDSCDRWPAIRVFGGRVEPVFPRDVNKFISSADFSSYVFGRYQPYPDEQISEGTTPCGANCWFRRSVFDDGFLYDPDIGPCGIARISGSEMELFDRLMKNGEKIVYIPSSIIFHRIQDYQLTIKYLLKRSYASGRGWVRIKRPDENAVFLFGAPRYMYRIIFQKFILLIWYFLNGKNFYEPMMKIAGYWGSVKEYIRINKG
ncbi:MAG: glycosyltransferase family 2 protein [Desulfobulbus sp.]|nr:glycosyltransferase family 2 protein [Desulfobulbus sp.]